MESKLEKDFIVDWLRVLGKKELAYIGPEESAYNAIIKLIQNRIHRLPIIDPITGNVLHIITHKVLLKHLHDHIKNFPNIAYLHNSIISLGVGTHKDIITAKEDTTVIEALDIFVKHRISGVPIVDSFGQVVDLYSRFDVINIAAQKTYSKLDISLKEANKERNMWFRYTLMGLKF